MNIKLKIWNSFAERPRPVLGLFVEDVNSAMSFLENAGCAENRLMSEGKDPIAFDSDCREGFVGTCGMMIDGVPHGPKRGTTACQPI